MGIQELVTTDQNVLAGQPVFKGTRVPVESLFGHLEAGESIDEFLNEFPSVNKEQVVALLDVANKMIASNVTPSNEQDDLIEYLLNGPTFTEEQIDTINQTRNEINQWRTK